MLILPDEILEDIFDYLSYDEVSHIRLVCSRFNEVSKRVLKRGFLKVRKYNSQCLKLAKSRLPCQESERIIHPLMMHFVTLYANQAQISLLFMTFKKFNDTNMCCFVPGKVLDAIFQIIQSLNSVVYPIPTIETPCKMIEEMLGLSSIAMKHFDKKLATKLKKKQKGKVMDIRHIPKMCISLASEFLFSSVISSQEAFNMMTEFFNKFNFIPEGLNDNLDEHMEGLFKIINTLEKFFAKYIQKLSQKRTIDWHQSVISQLDVKLLDEEELEITKLIELIENTKVGKEGFACKNSTQDLAPEEVKLEGRPELYHIMTRAATKRQNGEGEMHHIMTRSATKRQNLEDETSTSSTKKSRWSWTK